MRLSAVTGAMRPSGVVADEELLQAWRDGDAGAGRRLVARHVATVYRFFRNKIDDGIEDLAHATFEDCLTKSDRVAQARSFVPYLLRMARNRLLMHLRRRELEGRLFDPATTSVADCGVLGSPSRVLARRQRDHRLLASLRRLPVQLQITVELYYWERMSVAEIGEVLDAPAGTIRGRLARARAQLKEILEHEGSLPEGSTGDDLDAWARSLRERAAADAR